MSAITAIPRTPRAVRQFLTTGQIARLLDVAPRTVTKLFDRGHLKGWRIPGSNDRRITRQSFVAFCKDRGIDVPIAAVPTVLAVSAGELFLATCREQFANRRWQAVVARTPFQAAQRVADAAPDACVIDAGSFGTGDATRLAADIAAAGVPAFLAPTEDQPFVKAEGATTLAPASNVHLADQVITLLSTAACYSSSDRTGR
jgi:excisionase family DNA binding protein